MHGMIFTFRLFIGADRDFENDHLLLMRLFLLAQVACHHQGRQKVHPFAFDMSNCYFFSQSAQKIALDFGIILYLSFHLRYKKRMLAFR